MAAGTVGNAPNGAEHGVVAVGDSLLTGYGPALAGVSAWSWAGWLAWALGGACLTQHAVNGATAEQVLRDQVPLVRERYQVAVTWLGANDLVHLDPNAFQLCVESVCRALQARSQTVAIATLPRSLRSPGVDARSDALVRDFANETIRTVAQEVGAVLVELSDALTGRWATAPDREHPTSLGQLEAAHVAAAALDRAGLRFARHLPDVASRSVPVAEQRMYEPTRRRLAAAIREWRPRRSP